MLNVHQALARLHRPPLLVRAARLGAADYDRGATLPRLLGPGPVPPVRAALARLLEIEAAQNAARQAGDVTYRAAYHVALLIAVTGEARLLDHEGCAAALSAQENASGIDSLRLAT